MHSATPTLPCLARRLGGLAAAAVIGAAAAAGAQPFAYVASLGADEVAVIDTATNSVVATLPGGDDPDGVAISADGTRAYVTAFLSNTLLVIDTASNTALATIAVGDGPVGVAVTPDGRRVSVANRRADSVSVIDAEALAELARIPVGNGPNAIAITPDGRSAYVTNSETSQPGEVSVVDLATDSVRATLAVTRGPNRVALTPDGRVAYVSTFRSWNAVAIDTATDSVLETLRIGYKPTSIAVNPNGVWAYVTDQRDGVLVIDVAAQRVTRALPVDGTPWSIGLQRNGGTGYVANFADSSVTVIDLGEEVPVATIAVGERPFAIAVNCVGEACNETPYTPKATKTVTETPTITTTPTETETPSPTLTVSPTNTLRPGLAHVVLELSAAGAQSGNFIQTTLTVRTGGQNVYGFHHVMQPPLGIQLGRCAVGNVPGIVRAEFGYDPSTCDDDTSCTRISVDIASEVAMSDGAALFTCDALIAHWAPVGTLRIRNIDVGAVGVDGETLATRGRDGIITALPPTSPTPDLTPYPSRTPSTVPTPTAPQPPEIYLQGQGASARAGERVTIGVTLSALGHDVAGIQNDLRFPAGLRVAARANGQPDCTVNPAVDKRATAFSFQPPGCTYPACNGSRALVLAFDNDDPIADGAMLYTCAVDIPVGTAPATYDFVMSELGGSTPDGGFIPTGGVNARVTILPGGSRLGANQIASTTSGHRCSAGTRDAQGCVSDADCPAGACVHVQGVCEGGTDAGLLCDCPGSSCAEASACGASADAGVCSSGERAGECCDRSFNCGRGGSCVAAYRLCASGASKGLPCTSDSQCVAAACVATGRRCAGGTFDGTSCAGPGDCPQGTCLDPNAAPPTAVPTAKPRGGDTSGCAIVAPRHATGTAWLLLPALALLLRHRQPPHRTQRAARRP